MREQEGHNRGADPGRGHRPGACSILAPFSQVRLTLQLPADAYDATLYRNFPLREDEQLLAVIDCGKGDDAGFCA